MKFPQLIIQAIIVAAAIGICLVLLHVFGIAIPGWIITILWIVLAAVIGIVAIRYLMSLNKGP